MKIIDAHIDAIVHAKKFPEDFLKGWKKSQIDFIKMKKAKIDFAFFSFFIPEQKKRTKTNYVLAINKIRKFFINDKKFNLILDKKDLKKQKGLGVILHLEGGDCISSLKDLDDLYNLGVRSIGIAFDVDNSLVGSLNSGKGLSRLGKEVIYRMNELEIIIDVSHMNEKSFWEVFRLSKKPLVATHSNVFEISDNKRNLNDKQIKALAKNGGMMGIFFSAPFLNDSGKANINDIISHIGYVIKLVGADYVGIGSDFGGILSGTPKGMEDISKLPKIVASLEKKEYPKKDIEKIMGDNWIRVIRKIL